MKKIAIITATRAEYGLLKPIYLELSKRRNIEAQLIVTGTHLSKKHGYTINEILNDEIIPKHKISILGNTEEKTFSNSILKFSNLYNKEKYDGIVLLGDRYETLGFAVSALFCKIPIFHLYGGETTEGAIDEAIRHSITKMSYLHFTSCEKYRERVIQLGEDPKRVFNVGAVGIENVLKTNLITKKDLSRDLNFNLNKYFVVTYHPVTLESDNYFKEFKYLLSNISKFKNYQVVFTKSNADKGGKEVNKLIDNYVKIHKNSIAVFSLGTTKYLSLVKNSELVIGNSSSGITEVPALLVPTINIGNRQKGRILPKSVINSTGSYKDIKKALKIKSSIRIKDLPFYKKNTSKLVADIIIDYINNYNIDLMKKFYDIKI